MTRAEAKDYLPIIKAYSEGKQIQWLDETGRWHDANDKILTFYSPPSNYRIKPEPKYRPFKTQEECWNEMHKHSDFGWIMFKGGLSYCHIGDIFISESEGLMIVFSVDEKIAHKADKCFLNYTFTDGEPFGIKE